MSPSTLKIRALQAVLRLFGALPLGWLQRIGQMIGTLSRRLMIREARVSRRNIALCFPNLPAQEQEKLWQETLCETGKTLTETLRFWTQPAASNLRHIVEVENHTLLKEALHSGRGVVIAAPHLGNWELLNQWLAAQSPLAIVYRPPRQLWMETVILAARGHPGVTQVRAEAAGVRTLFKLLKEGGMVGILPDQQPKQGDGEFAPFYGIPALTMSLLSRLAHRTDAIVIMAFAERLPQGFRIHLLPAPEAIASADIRLATAALNESIERCIALAPAQYQWSYKRFTIRPEGSPPIAY